MEEKKLTDDTEIDVGMIVKALECCKQNEVENTCAYCSECPASDWDCEEDITDCTVDLSQKASNLIHRLQSENEKLKAERERREDILQAVTNSARVFVSSPIGDLPLNIKGLKKAVDYITKQKAEIERLTERLDYCQKSSDYHEGNQKELEKRNAELQKQVDYWRTETIETRNDKAKSVKDTAKEIYGLAVQYYNGYETDMERFILLVKERYGVEVE